jgi:LysR family transcriptional regulator, transcriptional activator of nhaA
MACPWASGIAPALRPAYDLRVLNFNHVYYFHVVATEGSIARAADRLGVTQPTVSEQVRALEKALATELFERTSSGLVLTEAGRRAYEHTTSMFRSGERLIESIGQLSAEDVPRTLRVGITAAVSRTIAADFLMPVITFDECLPTIRSGEFPELLRALRQFDLDLVLCESQPVQAASRGLRVVDVHRPRLIAVTSPHYLGPAGAIDWNDAHVIQYRASSAYRWEVDAFFVEQRARPRIIAETDDALLMVEAAARGACVAFVPRSVVRDALTTGRLRVVAALDAGSAAVYGLFHDAESAALARRAVDRLLAYAREVLEVE